MPIVVPPNISTPFIANIGDSSTTLADLLLSNTGANGQIGSESANSTVGWGTTTTVSDSSSKLTPNTFAVEFLRNFSSPTAEENEAKDSDTESNSTQEKTSMPKGMHIAHTYRLEGLIGSFMN